MTQTIMFKKEILHFIFIFLIPVSLFSQTKPDVMSKAVQDSSKSITIHQEVNFRVAPQKVYQTLLNSKEFSASTKKSFNAFSEKSAIIDSSVGGIFSLFDGHIIGRILELVPNQRVVEAWRVVDWPAGKYSIVQFQLTSQGSGTHLSFDHIGFPEGLKEHLSTGWQQHYWDALNNYFQ
ncbi:MAG: SRPBCC domain-containing protein [Ginsengibacter sp.]